MNGAELTFTRTEQLNDHYPVYQALDQSSIRIFKISLDFVNKCSVLLEDIRNRKHFDPWKTSLFGENVFMWWMWHNNVGHWVVNEYENFFLK